MALFLAIVTLEPSGLPPGIVSRMKDALAPAGSTDSIESTRIAAVYSDLALWAGRSVVRQGDLSAIVAGDPLVCNDEGPHGRQQSIAALLGVTSGSSYACLPSAEGTFCGIVIDLGAQRVTAFTDKLGVRPVYLAHTGKQVYISNARWALESLVDVPKVPNWVAAAEVAAFGYPLADRTLYMDIRAFNAGEVTHIDGYGIRSERYWDWSIVASQALTGIDPIDRVRESFRASVGDRIQQQRSVLAFLSGGMDSRLIVSFLREAGVDVHTINFAPQGSQDLVLGSLAAAALGTTHFEYAIGDTGFSLRQQQALTSWRQSLDQSVLPEWSQLIWSGDGGSVGLGHVYLSPEIVYAARENGTQAAAEALLQQNSIGVSPHLFVPDWQYLVEHPLRATIADLESRPNIEPGRNCHLFFMLNDQRRHLVQHYETVHIKRMDMVLPFFDGRFVEAIVASDIDPFIGHRLYNEIITGLPFGAGEVPWQAYPGHAPCPVPVPPGLRQQWTDGWLAPAAIRRDRREQAIQLATEALTTSFPDDVLSRTGTLLACLATTFGASQYRYMIDATIPFRQANRFRGA